jgi:hypothetical protein
MDRVERTHPREILIDQSSYSNKLSFGSSLSPLSLRSTDFTQGGAGGIPARFMRSANNCLGSFGFFVTAASA